jgi:hypothetical protein
VWLPTAREEAEKIAVPLLRFPVPRVVAPSLNVTVPVTLEGVTAAVRVTVWPGEDDGGAIDKVVVVAARFTTYVVAADWPGALLVSPL